MDIRPITQDEISRGIDCDVVRFITDPNMDAGTVCEIGASWFYFGGPDAENAEPAEYVAKTPKADIARLVAEALQEFENEIEYTDEWAYYRAILDESLPAGR